MDVEHLYLCAALVTFTSLLLLKKKSSKRGPRKKLWCRNWLKRRSEGRGVLNMLNQELLIEDKWAYSNFLRMPNSLFVKLLQKVESRIAKQDTIMRESVPAGSRLEITLRFLATGESFRSLMYSTRVHDTTISRFIPQVCTAIYETLKDEFLKIPSTEKEWEETATHFYNLWDFPHCLGALDGRHIEFRAPRADGSYYYNYKGTNSIVLLGLVGANYQFLYANVGTNGRISDGGVFRESGLGESIKENTLNFPKPQPLPGGRVQIPYVIVADDAFPLSENIMKPYSQRGLTHDKKIFNYRLSRARRIVENAFGILANRFRVLLTPINLRVEKVEIITLCCIALHNYLIKEHKEYINDSQSLLDGNSTLGSLKGLGQQGGNRTSRNAQDIREEFCRFFNSPFGSRYWQEEQILRNNM